MKKIRVFMIIFILNACIGFFGSFYFLSQNLSNPVKHEKLYPFQHFPVYNLQPSGDVNVNFINIIISALLLAIPFTLIILFLNRVITKNLDYKGRV
ncbi:hypothetical protein P4594_28135 [Priestia megaterium]|uniref:hypothetical protein n=1 Tax=Priestia megaterium TaxID=1404 RepID=UPI000BF3C973|nr:hypothetical protein [Priestia megaterium]MED3928907.1 hypothetical protein [Priestia megaterium]PFK67933.1 hypothetical protein COJ21_23870 [Priestia megaterium]RFB19479.1 hypothetical protein DZB87_28760 [Bacillus sp. ALD]RFB32610.1 hypothetical protein DZB86_29695 [Bacillus sp. RC]